MNETQKIHDIAQKKSNVITDIQHLQFTELSGRCSVFERPLSDAKRPLIFN